MPHGIPIFLDQLIGTLSNREVLDFYPIESRVAGFPSEAVSEVGHMASLHGRDLQERGFTLDRVVRDYGNFCQTVMNLAYETGAPIEVDEFRTFNRCLDEAIAGAVTEFARRQSLLALEENYQAISMRLAPIAHELRNHLDTATLAVRAIKAGNVAISGATGIVLDHSLFAMHNLIHRALVETRITSDMPMRYRPIRLRTLVSELTASYSPDFRSYGSRFSADPVDENLKVYADPEVLFAAIGQLLQNASKFTQAGTEVRLRIHGAGDRVLIDIEDHCGGLALGSAANLLSPINAAGEDRTGGGLYICRVRVEANSGILRVRDVPGYGCVFSIDLGRYTDPGGLQAAAPL